MIEISELPNNLHNSTSNYQVDEDDSGLEQLYKACSIVEQKNIPYLPDNYYLCDACESILRQKKINPGTLKFAITFTILLEDSPMTVDRIVHHIKNSDVLSIRRLLDEHKTPQRSLSAILSQDKNNFVRKDRNTYDFKHREWASHQIFKQLEQLDIGKKKARRLQNHTNAEPQQHIHMQQQHPEYYYTAPFVGNLQSYEQLLYHYQMQSQMQLQMHLQMQMGLTNH